DLVLRRADLVVGVLDVDAELLEGEHRLAAQIGAGVQRGQVEVAALVEDLGGLAVAEVEVLQLGTDEEVVEAHRAGALDRAAQNVTRIALVRRALARDHVAATPPAAGLLRTPAQ